MKLSLNSIRKLGFDRINLALSFAVAYVFVASLQISGNRTPAAEQSVEIELQSIALSKETALQTGVQGAHVKVTLDNKHEFKDSVLVNLQPGEGQTLSSKFLVPIEALNNDTLDLRVELVKPGILEKSLVRCQIVSKNVSQYNRSYQCFLPNESVPFLVYRLNNSNLPRATLAQAR